MDSIEVQLDSLGPAVSRFVATANEINTQELNFLLAAAPAETRRDLEAQSDRIMGLINRMVCFAKDIPPQPDLLNITDVLDEFEKFVEITDDLLEKSDTIMDDLTGRGRNHMSKFLAPSAPVMLTTTSASGAKRSFLSATNIRRPQLEFPDTLDNSNTPFVPKITFKYNAKRPLDYGNPDDISDSFARHIKSLGISGESHHAYEYEINTITYPQHVLQKRDEVMYKSFADTPFTHVETKEQLDNMLALLNKSSEIAVDLEGFTCLMQVSTRTQDFVIDALKLRGHLHLLNEPFTNQEIIKVFHGAEMDIQWLQKDFGVYIVGLFDTFHASGLLQLEGRSLSFLLRYYCGIHVDKKYQLADWRIRPLPQEMMDYARSDTHYLLYVYDKMRNALHDLSNPETLNILRQSLKSSEQTSLKQYHKELYNAEGDGPNGWRLALGKCGIPMSPEQAAVFKALHQWRDHTARQEDESLRYTLPQHMLIAISSAMPSTAAGVSGLCNPVPTLVRLNIDDIVALISDTRREYTATQKARADELARIQAEYEEREKIWEAKRKAGPVHTLFTEDGEADRPSDGKRVRVIEIAIKETPDFSLVTSAMGVEKNTVAWKMAETVRKNLVLVAPGMKEVDEAPADIAEESMDVHDTLKNGNLDVPQAVAEIEEIPEAQDGAAEGHNSDERQSLEVSTSTGESMDSSPTGTPDSKGQPVILSQIKQQEEMDSRGLKRKELPEGSAHDDPEAKKKARKKARKNKKKQAKMGAVAAQVDAASVAAVAPFDYSTAKSAMATPAPAVKAAASSKSNGKRKGDQRGKPGKKPTMNFVKPRK